MKRSLLYSVIFHVLVAALVLFLIKQEQETPPEPFYASIVTPEELGERPRQGLPKAAPAPRPVPRVKPAPPASRAPRERPALSEPRATGPREPAGRSAPQAPPAPSVPQAPQSPTPQGAPSARPSRPGGGPKTREPESMREKLFDRDVIAKLSRPDPEDAKQRKGITFETKDFKYYGYMRRLKEKIESIWRYPPEAAERGIYGDLYIQFTIKKNGRLGAVELMRTSGYKSLDDAAIKALREGEPYWPLPDDWNMDGLTITGHFVYTLHGFYVR